MLTSITIDAIDDIQIPIIGATIANKYIIKSISGLGPPDINVVLGDLASDGGIYQGRRVPSRNPVILMGFNPDYSQNETVDDLRDALYVALLQPNNMSDVNPLAKIILHDTVKPDRTVEGYVEKFEISHFVKDPEVQISILCPDPFLKGAAASIIPTLVDTIAVTNPGTAPTGFKMTVTLTVDTSGFQLIRDSNVILDLDYAFLAGDVLEINTINGSRRVRRKRAGVWLNIIDSLNDLNVWPMLSPGDNEIMLSTSNVLWTSLDYTPQWWGV